MSPKHHLIFGSLHFSILSLFTYKESSKRLSLYNILFITTHKNYLHLLHFLFLIFIIYSLTSYFLFFTLGPLRPQEISILNDNLFLFLTDILLVLSVFSRDLNFRNALLFFIILGFKSLVWMINTRIDFDINEKLFPVSLLISFLSFINFIFFLYLSFYNFTVLFLFSFEFSLIFLSSLKNLLIIKNINEDDDKRSLFTFYIEIGYLLILFLLYSSFIIITSLKFKVPLNVFRSSIVVLEKLITKIKLFKKYLKLCEDLENCEEGRGDPTCPICREDMDLGKKLRCKHVFHLECLKKWCERQQFCPICKVDLMLNLKEEVIYTENERIQGVVVDV